MEQSVARFLGRGRHVLIGYNQFFLWAIVQFCHGRNRRYFSHPEHTPKTKALSIETWLMVVAERVRDANRASTHRRTIESTNRQFRRVQFMKTTPRTHGPGRRAAGKFFLPCCYSIP